MSNNRFKDKEGKSPVKPVTIETVDGAVFDYFDKKLDISVEGPQGTKKVNVIFAVGERWRLIRKQGFRDNNGTLVLPLISIKRMDIDRTPGFSALGQETRSLTITRRIHPKTSFIHNLIKERKLQGHADKEREPVYEIATIPFPDFSQIYYDVTIWTQYQTQMNEILEKIFYNYEWRDSFVMPVDYEGKKQKGEGYYFVGFREGNIIKQSNDEDYTDQERIIRYVYNIRVPSYLMPDLDSESVSYGRDENGEQILFKKQTANKIRLKEEVLSLEEFEKMFG